MYLMLRIQRRSDESDAVFSIVDLPSPVTLLTPNSGQIWVAGTTQDINYTPSSASVNIKFVYR